MSIAETNDWVHVLNRVASWPAERQVALAKKILETQDAPIPRAQPSTSARRGLSASELQALLATDRPAPDDETVERWVDEHRMEKYGR